MRDNDECIYARIARYFIDRKSSFIGKSQSSCHASCYAGRYCYASCAYFDIQTNRVTVMKLTASVFNV